MKKDFILAIFDDEEKLVHCAEKAKSKNVEIYDCYTPFPVHGLDDALGIKRSILPYITFLAGTAGLASAIGLQVWISTVSWPTIVGGKPFLSGPAFVPISFELTVLFAAHTTVLAFLLINKLFPGKKPVIFDEAQTDYKFVLAVEKEKADLEDIKNMFGTEASEVLLKNIEMNP